ncbi:hypothetical protein, partial [Clostridium perfringens]
SGTASPKATKTFSTNTIIDSSYVVPNHAQEKFKKLIYELQIAKKNMSNSQALLLRCLIDTSTKYIADVYKDKFKINESDLTGSIKNTLNFLGNSKLLDNKHIERIRTLVKKDKAINYFNGVAHHYDYRPDYTTVKEIWDAFEPYITICISQELKKN